MQKSQKAIISTATLVSSLLSYWYAKETGKDAAPYVMVGAFVGTLLGELIVEKSENDKQT